MSASGLQNQSAAADEAPAHRHQAAQPGSTMLPM
jgi:hypothetical protein